MLVSLLAASASAAVAEFPITLVGGWGGGLGAANAHGPNPEGHGSFGGFVDGHLVIQPGKSPIAADISSHEGYFTSDGRIVGSVNVEVRYKTAYGLYAKGGFVHHHETAWEDAKANPLFAAIGSAPSIRHRSGLGLGVGWDINVLGQYLDDRVGVAIDVSGAWFPDDGGPQAYVLVSQAFTIDVGKHQNP